MSTIIASSAAAVPAMAGPLGWFEKDDKNSKPESQLLTESQISLSQAIVISEKRTGEKAVSADLEEDDKTHNVIYSVETLGVKESHKLIVDAKTGKIIKLSVDNGHDEDNEDGEENDD